MMRVLVCGGRDYERRRHIFETLADIHGERDFDLVITGGAPGADTVADRWAKDRGIDRAIFPANWEGRGKGAGHHRNRLMLVAMRPQLVIAFPGGFGTENMVAQAKAANIEVIEVKP